MAPARSTLFALTLLVAVTALSGCLGDEGAPADPDPDGPPTQGEEPVELYVVMTDNSLGAGSAWQVHPAEFEVDQGETVALTFKSADGNSLEHTLVLEAFEIRLGPLTEGQTANATFVADQAGEFPYFCDVGNHRQLGLEGTLIVRAS